MKKGFTLIELMVVIAIIGALALLTTGNFITSLKKGRDARRKADLEQIRNALEMFYEDKKAYPTFAFTFGKKLCETSTGDSCGTEKVYMQKIPNDPLSGRNYEYKTDATGASFKLYACLENNQQVLPYQSTGDSLTCGQCEYPAGTLVECVWGFSDTNSSP